MVQYTAVEDVFNWNNQYIYEMYAYYCPLCFNIMTAHFLQCGNCSVYKKGQSKVNPFIAIWVDYRILQLWKVPSIQDWAKCCHSWKCWLKENNRNCSTTATKEHNFKQKACSSITSAAGKYVITYIYKINMRGLCMWFKDMQLCGKLTYVVQLILR